MCWEFCFDLDSITKVLKLERFSYECSVDARFLGFLVRSDKLEGDLKTK